MPNNVDFITLDQIPTHTNSHKYYKIEKYFDNQFIVNQYEFTYK